MLAKSFVTPFRTTFIFLASQSELSIKSYVHLNFFRPKSLSPKIYDKSIQCKNSTILAKSFVTPFRVSLNPKT